MNRIGKPASIQRVPEYQQEKFKLPNPRRIRSFTDSGWRCGISGARAA
jgi:hypothetical protein